MKCEDCKKKITVKIEKEEPEVDLTLSPKDKKILKEAIKPISERYEVLYKDKELDITVEYELSNNFDLVEAYSMYDSMDNIECNAGLEIEILDIRLNNPTKREIALDFVGNISNDDYERYEDIFKNIENAKEYQKQVSIAEKKVDMINKILAKFPHNTCLLDVLDFNNIN